MCEVAFEINPKKTMSMVVSLSRISASGYCDLTLGGAELEESRLTLLDSVVRSAEKLYEGEL